MNAYGQRPSDDVSDTQADFAEPVRGFFGWYPLISSNGTIEGTVVHLLRRRRAKFPLVAIDRWTIHAPSSTAPDGVTLAREEFHITARIRRHLTVQAFNPNGTVEEISPPLWLNQPEPFHPEPGSVGVALLRFATEGPEHDHEPIDREPRAWAARIFERLASGDLKLSNGAVVDGCPERLHADGS